MSLTAEHRKTLQGARRKVERARGRVDELLAQRDHAIRLAVRDGGTWGEVAEHAGVRRQRVGQIANGD